MAEENDRLQEILAAYLEHLEMGGPEPDTSHLSAAERAELQELIGAMQLTEGIAFGRGREGTATRAAVATTEEGERLVTEMHGVLSPDVRIDPDENRLVAQVGGVEILDRVIVGTFGGRVRVWLVDAASAEAIDGNADCMADLNRVFRMFPDMAAVALVGRDLSCLIVEPEDCAPQIQVPSGSMVARHFRRALQPATEAIPDYLDELIPYWDPMPAFDPNSGLRVDVSEIGDELVRAAVERQRGIGERARKGNPKKDALLRFGDKEVAALNEVAKGLFEGSLDPDEIEERIERLARRR